MWRRHPIVYEINARVWLGELGRRLGRHVDLESVPDAELDHLQQSGLDGVWLMGVWSPSPASRRIALRHAGLGAEYRRALPDLADDDVLGSPFAVLAYRVSSALGGEEGLDRFRGQLADRGLRLMLDFVPNHMAIDHKWTESHPEHLMQCRAPEDFGDGMPTPTEGPEGCFARATGGKSTWFAHGRDPYFPPWTDTVQIDYRSPRARKGMVEELLAVAERCDGVRCDMAMLVTNEVFGRTWGDGADQPPLPAGEFWAEAIAEVRARHTEFIFLAEVYWEMEPELLRQGFDYAYDKKLYDLLLGAEPSAVDRHLRQNPGQQGQMARFIENHDERRAAESLGTEGSKAAAVLVATLPGLRLFHQGQFEGRRVRVPVQLGRAPAESQDPDVYAFYRRLLTAASADMFHTGEWRLLRPGPAWAGNGSHRNIIAYQWRAAGGSAALIAVNLSAACSQARIHLSLPGLAGSAWQLRELLDEDTIHPTIYHRDGSALAADGLYVELEPDSFHFLSLSATGGSGDHSDDTG